MFNVLRKNWYTGTYVQVDNLPTAETFREALENVDMLAKNDPRGTYIVKKAIGIITKKKITVKI